MGVDTNELGAPCITTFRNASNNVRATVKLPQSVVDSYGGGPIGLLRPHLYSRMLAALPPNVIEFNKQVEDVEDRGDHVELKFPGNAIVRASILIGADGIDSKIRTHLWGDSPKRNHNLHIIGGFTMETIPNARYNECVLTHNKDAQGTYSTILSNGTLGIQWWVLEAWPDAEPAPQNLREHAMKLADGFQGPLKDIIDATQTTNLQRWPSRDRTPLKKWSKGRITLAGDAAHATSPYAAYGAGMSICDGYFLGQCLYRVDLNNTSTVKAALEAYEACQLEHTTSQVNRAYFLGRLFHHTPFPVTYLRDWFLDWTNFLQREVGDGSPAEIMQQLSHMGLAINQPA